MSYGLNVELQAACAALGYIDNSIYYKATDCIESAKDLIRFLKREDDTCDIRQQLGEAQILQNDLIPIVKQYKNDRALFDATLRLLVNLSQPAILCFKNNLPEDKVTRNHFLKVETYLQSYKEAFADELLFTVLTEKLAALLKLDWEHRHEEDRLLIERILILLRNTLHIPPNPAGELRTDDDASVHDQVIWALHVSGLEDLLLYVASAEDEQQFSFHVLEIVSLMFREQTPDQLASAGGPRSQTEREADEKDLAVALERERAVKRAKTFKHSSRHSRFGGTFTVANLKSIGSNDMIFHRPLNQTKDLSFDQNKSQRKTPKNRRAVADREEDHARRSTLSIRLALKQFCLQFLEQCYNPLMKSVKGILLRSGAQDNDETYYLWAMRFFMEFNRKASGKDLRVDLVGETMSVTAFHYIQTNLQTYFEMLLSNKKEGKIWSRRMHLALKAYFELLHTLNAMDHSSDPDLRDSAEVISGNVFYMMEYRDIFLLLLKKFDESKQSRGFLKDLVEATHLYTRMLEGYSKKHTHLVVQKKVKRKKKAPKPRAETTEDTSEQELEEKWDAVSGELSAIFQGRGEIPSDVMPFDAASEVEVEQQRAEAMLRIQDCLRENRAGEAVGLIRAARQAWPEGSQFGEADISPEDEFMALREIFYANLPRARQIEEVVPDEQEEDEIESNEEDDVQFQDKEQEFRFKDFVTRFSQPQVVSAYITLLREFHKNTTHTNHCLVKMLHRVGFDCKLVGMLYQASLFRIFQKVMFDPAYSIKHYDELRTFAKYVVRSFFESATKNNKIFMELFFFKSVRDAVEVQDGYGSYQTKTKGAWTEEEDEELRVLYEEYQHKEREERDGDVIDYVMPRLIDQTRTRRAILKQLKWLGIIEGSKDIQAPKEPSKRKWAEQEIEQLRHLYDKYKDMSDPMPLILEEMTVKRSRATVLKKMLEEGIIADKKEMRRKKMERLAGGNKRRRREQSDGEEEEMPEPDVPSDVENEADDDDLDNESEADQSDASSADESDDPKYVQDIRKFMRRSIKKGHSAAVDWLRGSLNRVADQKEEDDDEDDTEGIPIVPLTEEQETAMDSLVFKALLKRCGVEPPANEQEQFWRVNGRLLPVELRCRARALEPREKQEPKGGAKLAALKNMVKQKQDKAEGKRRSIYKRSKTTVDATEPNETGDGAEMETSLNRSELEAAESGSHQSAPDDVSQPGSGKKSRVKRVLSESEDSDDERLVIASPRKQPSAKKPRLQDSDDESEADLDTPGQLELVSQHSNQSDSPVLQASSADNSQSSTAEQEGKSKMEEDALSGSEEDKENKGMSKLHSFPATALSQPISDEDSDVDDHVTFRGLAKRRAAILEDSDSD